MESVAEVGVDSHKHGDSLQVVSHHLHGASPLKLVLDEGLGYDTLGSRAHLNQPGAERTPPYACFVLSVEFCWVWVVERGLGRGLGRWTRQHLNSLSPSTWEVWGSVQVR